MASNIADKIDNIDFNQEKLPSGLNVLTILTFIGCAIGFIGSIWGIYSAKTNFDNKEQVLKQMNDPNMPGFAKKMMGSPEQYLDLITKSYENRWPIFILSLIAVSLCLYGAVQMRQRKKQGFLIYAIGEVMPLFVTGMFLGMSTLTGAGGIFSVALVVVFLTLYYVNRKHLIY